MKIPNLTKKIKIKKYQIIEIEWLDSLHTTGWMKEESVQTTPLEKMKHKTLGYFLREDEKSLLVIQSYGNFIEGSPMVDGIMEIPKGCILRIKKLINRRNYENPF
ncbi:hypothetical protein LCGC14_2861820 [marine sediment metagenome]|uniref:Uncharacterized protein n=1 Tax=marine sediment metagenome TaxID=412755 RepID=A0A0F8Y5Q0_9ZZZZ|nr:hypothetical protein [Candidatus Scalindua sp.]